jgi:hypothetical protein
MELTDFERAEFIAPAADTLDPELWSEGEYPILKGARDNYEKAQAREHGGVLPPEAIDATFSSVEPLF